MANNEEVPFTNAQLNPEDLRQEDIEEIHFHKIEPSYWLVMVIKLVVTWIILVLIALVVKMNFPEIFPSHLLLIYYGGSTLFILTFILQRISFQKKAYAIREHDILFRYGIFSVQTVILPINKIQLVEVHEGFWMRFFKLATVRIHTAAGERNGFIAIPGLKKETAADIRQYLIEKVKGINEQNWPE